MTLSESRARLMKLSTSFLLCSTLILKKKTIAWTPPYLKNKDKIRKIPFISLIKKYTDMHLKISHKLTRKSIKSLKNL